MGRRFVLEGRKACLNIHYEKVHDNQVVAAVLAAARSAPSLPSVAEFMACEVLGAQPAHYRLFVELRQPVQADGGAELKAPLAAFAAAFDAALGSSCPDYTFLRGQVRSAPV